MCVVYKIRVGLGGGREGRREGEGREKGGGGGREGRREGEGGGKGEERGVGKGWGEGKGEGSFEVYYWGVVGLLPRGKNSIKSLKASHHQSLQKEN